MLDEVLEIYQRVRDHIRFDRVRWRFTFTCGASEQNGDSNPHKLSPSLSICWALVQYKREGVNWNRICVAICRGSRIVMRRLATFTFRANDCELGKEMGELETRDLND
jgi:hypothetical protein